MEETAKWLLGLITTIGLAMTGYVRHVAQKAQTDSDMLHSRVNQIRDEYVKRIDLDAHMARQDRTAAELKAELKEFARDIKAAQDHTNSRLDAVLTKLSEKGG
ncbi:MAG: hypothetical protein ACOVN5_07175 [Aquidulcibacter sp.]